MAVFQCMYVDRNQLVRLPRTIDLVLVITYETLTVIRIMRYTLIDQTYRSLTVRLRQTTEPQRSTKQRVS